MKYDDIDRKRDLHYFEDNVIRMYDKYGRCVVAVKNRETIGTFNSYSEAIQELESKYKYGSYSLFMCPDDIIPVRVAGVRVSQ